MQLVKLKIMKKIIFITLLTSTTLSFSQNPVIDLVDRDGTRINGAYYKDVNDLLSPFEGTYIYTNGNKMFKILLEKKVMQYNTEYYEDLIIGEYQYTVNGVDVSNTLSQINTIYNNQRKHNIEGNFIIDFNEFRMWQCPECNPNEIRLKLSINDVSTGRVAKLFIRRMNVSGQDVIKVKISHIMRDFSNNPNPPDFTLPKGEFVMVKQ
ncbi:hypothetical protein Q764_14245 [Flavobacterium suncheonense GH29-5 = DSM 17707]|uniref:DUF6705 domain-containing protein n=2 Tax=Flavobacterium suncheonense TaxID=350894 RepID=A0A0A2M0I7_9FLAO|nr:hypothetical protein Q764_14245 [Flavobacterium suncheonense GH29-5 = DSM 17707]